MSFVKIFFAIVKYVLTGIDTITVSLISFSKSTIVTFSSEENLDFSFFYYNLDAFFAAMLYERRKSHSYFCFGAQTMKMLFQEYGFILII